MKIELKKIAIRELVDGYVDDPERGVSGYGGRLDIRPEYQREFVYKEKDRDAVIRTVMRGFPLNVMYWAKKKDGTFEVMDGQQRTISICQYVAGDFAWGDLELGNFALDILSQQNRATWSSARSISTGSPRTFRTSSLTTS